MKTSALLLALGFLSATCGEMLMPTVTNVEFVGLDSFSNGRYHGRGRASIRNHGVVSIASKKVEFELYYGGRVVTTGSAQENFTLKGNSETVVPVRFAILIDSLVPGIDEILSKDSVEFDTHMRGSFTALDFNLEHKQKIKLPVRSMINGLVAEKAKNAVKIRNPSLQRVTVESTTIGFEVGFSNGFPFELRIDSIDFSVYSRREMKDKVGSWNIDKGFVLPSTRDTVLRSELLIDNSRAFSSILDRLSTRKMDFYVFGHITMEYERRHFKVPVMQHLILNPLTGEIHTVQDQP